MTKNPFAQSSFCIMVNTVSTNIFITPNVYSGTGYVGSEMLPTCNFLVQKLTNQVAKALQMHPYFNMLSVRHTDKYVYMKKCQHNDNDLTR